MSHEIFRPHSTDSQSVQTMDAVFYPQDMYSECDSAESAARDILEYPSPEGPLFLFFKGCGENYEEQAPALARKLGRYGTLSFPFQSNGEHSQERINESTLDVVTRNSNQEVVAVATSMGTMNAMNAFQNPEIVNAIGRDRLIGFVALSGMTSKYDLRLSMRAAAFVSGHAPQWPALQNAWLNYRMHKAHSDIKCSAGSTPEEVVRHLESSARLPYKLVSSQHRAINDSSRQEQGAMYSIVSNNPRLELVHLGAKFDGVTNGQKTIRSLKTAFGLPVESITDHRRYRGSHADDYAYIEALEQVMARFSPRYSSMFNAVANLETYRQNRMLLSAS